MYQQSKYILFLLFFTTGLLTQAQVKTDSLKREVEVKKSYTPTVLDANKLNSKAKIDDPEFQQPNFNYHIKTPQPVFFSDSVSPLKAATIQTIQHQQKGYGLVRAGLGTYAKSYGEVFFNNRNSKNSVFGIHVKHLSSFGDLKLKNGKKVDAPFMNNLLEVFTKYTINSSVLSVNVDLKHDAFRYYGYPTAVPDTLLQDKSLSDFGFKQSFFRSGVYINFNRPNATIDDETIGFNFDYHYFGTKTEQGEHYASFSLNYNRPIYTGTIILKSGIKYTRAKDIEIPNDSTESSIGKKSTAILSIKPAWYIGNKNANLTLGFNSWIFKEKNKDLDAKLSPNIRAYWAPVPELINIFAGLDGNFIHNHYSKIACENPYVNPYHNVRNSMQKIRVYGGFDGKFSKKTAFKFSGEYALTNDYVFYYLNSNYIANNSNHYTAIANNTFDVLYDDIKRVKLNAEIFHASSDKLNLRLSLNYYKYTMDEQEEAWNLPNWNATFSASYKVTEQLSLSADFFLTGERKALLIQAPNPTDISMPQNTTREIYNMDTIFDINIKGNYQITSKFSVFGQFNNMSFKKYEHWLGYPTQNFNILGGISYAF